ncbi:MAG: phage/plasmid primase, P4 family [Desulfomonilaceae bacterium]
MGDHVTHPVISHDQKNEKTNISIYRNALTAKYVLEKFGFSVGGASKINCFLPGHNDTNASLMVDIDHVHCFGCGYHADIIGLISYLKFGREEATGQIFSQCLDWIADEAGLPHPHRDPVIAANYTKAVSRSETFEKIWKDSLNESEPGLKYLENRGISRATSESLVGYLPPKYSPADVSAAQAAGLFSKNSNFLFAGRLIIPIRDHGSIVSLYGRAISDSTLPKHIYPSGSGADTFWHLGQCNKEDEVYLTEAILDGLTLLDNGIPNVISLFGTQSLSPARITRLKQSEVCSATLCFDSDSNGAGQKAAIKAGTSLFAAGFDVSIKELPVPTGATKVDVNSFFQAGNSLSEFLQIRTESFLSKTAKGLKGSPSQQFEQLKPCLELIAARPEALWKSYVQEISDSSSLFSSSDLLKSLKKNGSGSSNRSKSVKPMELVKAIQEKAPLMFAHETFFRYQSGYYRAVEEPEIRREMMEILADDSRSFLIADAVQLLKDKCFVRGDKLNPPGFLDLENCILDTSELKTTNHSPEFLCTVRVPIPLDEKAQCTLWEQTLGEILPDPQLQLLVQEIFGYCLTHDVSMQKAFLWLGGGSNGKSLVASVLEAMVGVENVSSVPLHEFGSRFQVSAVQGKLVNICSEVEKRGAISDGIVKALITGDPILLERKFHHPTKMRPYCKIVALSNDFPQNSDSSHGFYRRWLITPFERQFDGDSVDETLAARIIDQEMSGVLLWALEGLARLKERKRFLAPQASTDKHREFRYVCDPLLSFVDDCLSIKTDGLLEGPLGEPAPAIYSTYSDWCTDVGHHRLSRPKFYVALERTTKIKKRHTRNGDLFPGLFLKQSVNRDDCMMAM